MDNTDMKASAQLLAKAKAELADDMKNRGVAAIIWDLASAGFHTIPTASAPDGRVVRVAGIYDRDGVLYLLDEDSKKANMDNYYDKDTEVRPTVICLSESVAASDLGEPTDANGFTTTADLDQWLAIADCYFEALRED